MRVAAPAALVFSSMCFLPYVAVADDGQPAIDEKKPDVMISGYRKFKWKDFSASGNVNQFKSANSLNYQNDRLEQSGHISLFGKYDKGIIVNGNFEELPYQDRTLTLGIEGQHGKALLGDFSTVFPGGKLTTFSKNIRGIDFGYNFDNGFGVKAVVSQQKSQYQTESFKGRNIRGPYKLNTMSIIEGSESLRIDGNAIPADEYYFDYFTGEVTFMYSIDQTQTVEVTYESELLLDVNTGSVAGFGVSYAPARSNFSIGISAISEGTDADAKQVLVSKTEPVTPAAVALPVSLAFPLLEKYTERIYSGTASYSRMIDYSIDYRLGTVTIINPALVGQALTVEYFYYNPKYVRDVTEESIKGLGTGKYNDFQLSRGTIYAGTEVATLYYGSTRLRTLIPDTDYVINEDRNTITFHIAEMTDDYSVLISYRYVQKNAPEASTVKRQIIDATFKYSPIANLSLEGEVARTSADVTAKQVQVLEEYVTTVATATRRDYPLARKNVIYGSEEIYFDDILNYSNRKTRNSDYILETDSAGNVNIMFLHDVATGTTIIANYKYKPSVADGIEERDAEAIRAKAAYTSSRVSFSGEVVTKDEGFAPINKYNDLNKLDFRGDLSVALTSRFRAFGSMTGRNNAHDIESDNEDEFRETSGGLTYSSTLIPEFTFKHTISTASDNLTTDTRLDYERDSDEIIARIAPFRKDTLLIETNIEDRSFDDLTGKISDREISRQKFGVRLKPSAKFNMNTYVEKSAVESIAPAGFGVNSNYDTDTYTKSLTVNYFPDKVWSLSGDMLLQSRTDSRDSIADEISDSVRMTLAANPFGRFTQLIATVYRKNIPDVTTGGSRTDNISTSFGYRLARLWEAVPTYDKTISSTGTSSRSDSQSTGIQFRYNSRRTGHFCGDLRLLSTNRKSRSASSSTTSDETQYVVTGEYFPTSNFVAIAKYDIRGADADADTLSTELKYSYSDRGKASFTYTTDSLGGTSSSSKDYYTLKVTHKISKVFDVITTIERQQYSQSASSTNDYTGTVFSTELTATF